MGATSGALGVPVRAGLAHRPTNGRSLFVNIGSRAPKSLHEPGRDGAETPPAEQQSSPFIDGWSSLDPIFQDSIDLVNGKAPGKHPVVAQIHSKKVGQIRDLLRGIELATHCQNLLSEPFITRANATNCEGHVHSVGMTRWPQLWLTWIFKMSRTGASLAARNSLTGL